MGRRRRSRERVLEHLTELSRQPRGGGPDPAFRARLREQLAAATPADEPARVAARAPARHAHRGRARRRSLSAPLISFVLVTTMMMAAVTTYESVPGDALYPLKRATESTLIRLSADDVVLSERGLVSAETRAKEVAQLLGASGNESLAGKTLKDMERSTRSGISRLRRAEVLSPKTDTPAKEQRDQVEPMIEHLEGLPQDQAVGYLDYIEGLVVPTSVS